MLSSYDVKSPTAIYNCLQVFAASWNGDQQPERAGEGQGQGGQLLPYSQNIPRGSRRITHMGICVMDAGGD